MADLKTITRNERANPAIIGFHLANQVSFDARILVELKNCGALQLIADAKGIHTSELEHYACKSIDTNSEQALERLHKTQLDEPPLSDDLTDRRKAIKRLFLKGTDWGQICKKLQVSPQEKAVVNNTFTRPDRLLAKLNRKLKNDVVERDVWSLKLSGKSISEIARQTTQHPEFIGEILTGIAGHHSQKMFKLHGQG